MADTDAVNPGDDIGLHLHPVDRDAGQASGMFIAAYRVEVPAPGGEVQDDAEDRWSSMISTQTGLDKAEMTPPPIDLEGRTARSGIRRSSGSRRGRSRPSAQGQHPEGDDEGGKPGIGDQHPIDHAGEHARRARPPITATHQVAALQQNAADHADKAHQRADRQVDAAGDDHRRPCRSP